MTAEFDRDERVLPSTGFLRIARRSGIDLDAECRGTVLTLRKVNNRGVARVLWDNHVEPVSMSTKYLRRAPWKPKGNQVNG